MYARSGSVTRAASACAAAISSAACFSSAGSIGALMLGPSATATPQRHMAQPGSSFAPWRKELIASSWLKPYISLSPWSKYACAAGVAVTG